MELITFSEAGGGVSRRRIEQIMAKHGLISNYTVAKYKPHPLPCNNDEVKNELNREFIKAEPLDPW